MNNLILAIDGAIATITIHRPAALNALNSETVGELESCVSELYGRPEIRVLILTGSGNKAFVAGADIKEMSVMSPGDAWAFARRGTRTLALLAGAPFVTIAAVNGYALGGGCEIAIACDIIYAADHAVFGQPEVNLGIIPGFGGTQRLARLVGSMLARELILTGRMITAEDAHRMGLVAQVFPRDAFVAQVQSMARSIAEKGPLAMRAAKRVLNGGLHLSVEEGCRLEGEAFAELFVTDDQREGMTAFIDKRRPNFQAR